jgi:hypothetical protein
MKDTQQTDIPKLSPFTSLKLTEEERQLVYKIQEATGASYHSVVWSAFQVGLSALVEDPSRVVVRRRGRPRGGPVGSPVEVERSSVLEAVDAVLSDLLNHEGE